MTVFSYVNIMAFFLCLNKMLIAHVICRLQVVIRVFGHTGSVTIISYRQIFIMSSYATDPAPQPDPVDQRVEDDGHVDPEPLTPSTKDTGLQVQVTHIVHLIIMTFYCTV